MGRRSAILAFGLLDQAANSIATLLLSVAVLRVANLAEASEFSTGMVGYGLLISLARSLTSEPLAVEGLNTSAKEYVRRHFVFSVIIATVGLLGLALSFGYETGLGILFLVGAVLAIGADAVRTTYLSKGESVTAAKRSITQATITLGGAGAGLMLQQPRLALMAWCVGSGLVVVLALFQAPRTSWRMRPRNYSYMWEFVVTSGATQGSVLIGVVLVGESVAVAQRVGSTIFGPYMALYQAVALIAVPLLLPFLRSDGGIRRGRVASAWAAVSGPLLLVLAIYASAASAFIPNFGRFLFGVSWDLVQDVLPGFLLMLLSGALLAGIFLVARATGDRPLSLRIRIASGVLQVTCCLAGAIVGGAIGFFLGSAVANVVTFVVGLISILLWSSKRGSR